MHLEKTFAVDGKVGIDTGRSQCAMRIVGVYFDQLNAAADIVPDSLRDPRIQTRFVDANGLRFEVDECGKGNVLALCLHGFPDTAYSFVQTMESLGKAGYRVVAGIRCPAWGR